MIKPSLPKGTRDFSPQVMQKRNFILQAIRNVFELHGFQPLETPAMENLITLTGKYGEEGDKLIFKILDNGDILGRAQQAKDSRELAELICEKALRYDLTIPFARFVVMNQHELAFPFKRYQIQPVWRADRPQKGRYREFYQCDADVVGSDSLLNEVELVNIYQEVFTSLDLKAAIHINSRKILSALAIHCGDKTQITTITTAIDKLDKIGPDKVKEELLQKGLDEKAIAIIREYLSIDGNNIEKIAALKSLMPGNKIALQGIAEIEYILRFVNLPEVVVDFTLARGLNYYTGIILEVKAKNIQMGSIGGGGRYDDLTGLFGLPGLSGVGISFGVDRIYDVMEELQLFPKTALKATKVLFLNFGDQYEETVFNQLDILRKKGIAAELFPDSVKIDKQLKYANKRNIPYVAIFGESEKEENVISIKNLASGAQEKIKLADLTTYPFD
jgi:histidyl-tRNA synthetase